MRSIESSGCSFQRIKQIVLSGLLVSGSEYIEIPLVEVARLPYAFWTVFDLLHNNVSSILVDAISPMREVTNITMTCADKYSQDSYGYTKSSYPVPLLADLERLVVLEPSSLEYGMIHTQLIRNKNRISDALYTISQVAALYENLLQS